MSELAVRDAVATDAAAVAAVHVASWQAAYDGLLPAAMLADLSVAERASALSRAIDASEVILVAESGEQILGYASVGASRDQDGAGCGELNAIYVDPMHWSTGAGHALHEAAMTRLGDLGYDHATLWVLDRNDRAISFYHRHGWLPDGATKLDERGAVTLSEGRFRRDV